MKPYGRVKTVKGGNNWKKDYHPKKGEHNWWETICCFLSRSRMKQIWKKILKKNIICKKKLIWELVEQSLH